MRDEILEELQKNKGHYISGEEISTRLNVSRTAIWKYMNQLKDMGYIIESQTKKGYRLLESPDNLLPLELKQLLNTSVIGRNIQYFDQIDSTNLHAKRAAEEGFEDGTVILADEQLRGKGRLGRTWASPKGKGIWMTIMLKPKINTTEAAKITLLAACSVCKAIEDICGVSPKIKWPNDLILNGKKVCGILTEMGAELDEINYLIVGIGINVNLNQEEFPEELQTIATSIKAAKGSIVSRKDLAAAIINYFECYYNAFTASGSLKDFIQEYREKSAVLGKTIRVISSGTELQGNAVDISDEGQLLVQLENGIIKEIISGEVSIRGLNQYI